MKMKMYNDIFNIIRTKVKDFAVRNNLEYRMYELPYIYGRNIRITFTTKSLYPNRKEYTIENVLNMYPSDLQTALSNIFADAKKVLCESSDKAFESYKKETRKTNYIYTSYRWITKVIFNDPATIVFWSDGTKTVVKVDENETFDPEKGLAMAISKKILGNQGNYYNEFKKWLPKEEEKEEDELVKLYNAFSKLANLANKRHMGF